MIRIKKIECLQLTKFYRKCNDIILANNAPNLEVFVQVDSEDNLIKVMCGKYDVKISADGAFMGESVCKLNNEYCIHHLWEKPLSPLN